MDGHVYVWDLGDRSWFRVPANVVFPFGGWVKVWRHEALDRAWQQVWYGLEAKERGRVGREEARDRGVCAQEFRVGLGALQERRSGRVRRTPLERLMEGEVGPLGRGGGRGGAGEAPLGVKVRGGGGGIG